MKSLSRMQKGAPVNNWTDAASHGAARRRTNESSAAQHEGEERKRGQHRAGRAPGAVSPGKEQNARQGSHFSYNNNNNELPATLVHATDRTFTRPEAQGPVSTVSCMGRGAAGTHASWQKGARATWMGISPAHRITIYRCL